MLEFFKENTTLIYIAIAINLMGSLVDLFQFFWFGNRMWRRLKRVIMRKVVKACAKEYVESNGELVRRTPRKTKGIRANAGGRSK